MNAPLQLAPPHPRTLADLVRELGDIPMERIRMNPPIGTATIADMQRPDSKGCELVKGTLVEKAMGFTEGWLAAFLIELLGPIVRKQNLGILVPGDAGSEILTGEIRKPDVAFFSWERIPSGRRPREPYPPAVPDLAVEVLSISNTPDEMKRKRKEYFKPGVRLVWIIDPEKRTVEVYTSPTRKRVRTEDDELSGAPVLPEFSIALRDFFAELDRHG
jgi:Uma2 family endonuclease